MSDIWEAAKIGDFSRVKGIVDSSYRNIINEKDSSQVCSDGIHGRNF